MADGMRIDPERMAGAAKGFDAVAESVDAAFRALAAALSAEGASWGSDEVGTTFAAQYVPGQESGTTAISGLSDALVAIASGLRGTAQAFAADDTGFAGELDGGL